MRRSVLILGLLLASCFSVALRLDHLLQIWAKDMPKKGSLMEVIMGDSRRLLGDYFFAKADIYFHSGYYISRFGGAKEHHEGSGHMAGATEEHEHEDHAGHADHEEEEHAAPDAPKDWIEAFGRKFYPSEHTHLDEGGPNKHDAVQEILPWLKFSADLDPNRIETYTVSAYWLSQRLHKPKEAEAFLREGLGANPGNPSILFELSRIAASNDKDLDHAVNLLELALAKWKEQEGPKKEPNTFLLEQIYGNLAKLETERGKSEKAIEYLKQLKSLSPHPEAVEKQIEDLEQKKK